MMKGGRARQVRGMAILEGAAWLTVILPILMVGVSVIGTVHDQNALQVVPEAALREVYVEGMQWVPGDIGGEFQPRLAELRQVVANVSKAGLDEATQGVFKARNLSSRACFWVYSVNSSTGMLETPITTECDVRGPLGAELSLERYVGREISHGRGIPVSHDSSAAQYVNRVVVIGLVVGGEIPELLSDSSVRRVEFGAVSLPRQEITL